MTREKPKQTIYIVIDESGAKGFADNQEEYLGDFGIIAGYIFHEKYLKRVTKRLKELRDRVESNGKIHITDLNPEDQQCIREELFEYIKEADRKIVYHGAYVQGLHDADQRSEAITSELKVEKDPHIRFHFKNSKERLLSEIFQNLFGKSVACSIDNHQKDLHLKIITDKIDEKILKEYKEKINEFFEVIQPSITKTAKGFNLETKKNLSTSLTTSYLGYDIDEARKNFSKISYELAIEDSPLTFAADIISNSLFRFLKEKIKANGIFELNSKGVFENHTLEHQIYGLSDPKSNAPDISDIVLRHPENNSLTK